ncbi:MAG: response regulator [Desulfamplus sp.]|nr:response regulator [Desulfamplus sp.]
MPEWVSWLIIALIVLSLALIGVTGFSLILKNMVEKRTSALIHTHEQLRLNSEALLKSSELIQQDESDIQTLVETMLRITGEVFFDHIVVELCRWLGCNCAIVGEIITGDRVKAIAMVMNSEPINDYSYKLSGTPCEEAINKGYCAYPEGVCEAFPDDLDLINMKAVGYVGVPIKNRKGEAIGILCCISCHKLNLTKRTNEVMNIIAAKISGEIERQYNEKERDNLQNRLKQAYKMESLGTLAGGIAHDFNNILIPILGYTEMLLDTTSKDNSLYDTFYEIHKAAIRAKDLVKQILTFSRQTTTDIAPMKIQPIVKEVLKLIRASIPSNIEIRQEIKENCGLVNTEPTHIHQIVMNLVTNAFHAMEDRVGILTIIVEEVEIVEEPKINKTELPPQINEDIKISGVEHKLTDYKDVFQLIDDKDAFQTETTPLPEGVYVSLTVADTGIGMTQEVMSKIFDPFFTTKEVGKGTGIGLSVVHGIVKSMNGAIKIYSKPNKGSIVRVYLPIVQSYLEEDENTIIRDITQNGNECILLVDDEESVIETENSILEYLGYNVVPIVGSIEALETFRANPYQFDIVITDLSMPKMSGEQLAREFIKIRPDIPIIISTGFAEKVSIKMVQSIGIKSVLTKPFTVREISSELRKVLDNSELHKDIDNSDVDEKDN